jgi:hypothetical protein
MHAFRNDHRGFNLAEADWTFSYVVALQIGNELLHKSIRTPDGLLVFREALDQVVDANCIIPRGR